MTLKQAIKILKQIAPPELKIEDYYNYFSSIDLENEYSSAYTWLGVLMICKECDAPIDECMCSEC